MGTNGWGWREVAVVPEPTPQTERPRIASGSGSWPPWLPGEPPALCGSGQDSPDPPGFPDTEVTVSGPQDHRGVHISTSRLGLPATVTGRWLPAVDLPSQPRAGVPETRPTVTVSRAEPKLMPTRCPPLPTTHRAPGLAQHSRAYLGDPRGGPGNHCLLTHDVRRTGGPC